MFTINNYNIGINMFDTFYRFCEETFYKIKKFREQFEKYVSLYFYEFI